MSHPNSSNRSLTNGSNAFIILKKNFTTARKKNQIQDKSVYYVAFIAVILLGVIVAYSFEDSSVSAAKGGIPGKSKAVQDKSNGFPSGPHLNLNIHGRDMGWNGCEDVTGDPQGLGGNVNAPIDGAGNITFVSNKKSSIDNMTVWDNCTENVHASDIDPAVVQLPKNDDGYYVYARILGKPNNGGGGMASNITLTPNLDVLTMCNDNSTNPLVGFDALLECGGNGILPLAVIDNGGITNTTGFELERWETTGKGKGRSLALDVTDRFTWSGTACNESLDSTAPFGSITLADFDVTNSTGGDPDGVVNGTDVERLLDDLLISTDPVMTWQEIMIAVTGFEDGVITGDPLDDTSTFFAFLTLINECVVADGDNPIWVFNAADLVIHGLEVENNGATNTQLRFYDAGAVQVIKADPEPDP